MYQVHLSVSKAYDIFIGAGLIEQAGAFIARVFKPCKAAVVTDSNVHELYAQNLMNSLRSHAFEPVEFVFPAGEQSKNLATLSDLLEWMAEEQLTRSDIVVALGGGVCGDMAGFAAAVYTRGISFVQIPTTLLAAVDASVGGKTAVDLKNGKNLAGAFHQPSLVLTDTDVMSALPPHLLSEGAAEIIKYGLLQDAELFAWMGKPNWQEKLPEIIARCVEIKRQFVMHDEYDNGKRKMLNLGHTFGHAIEACSDFSVTHGQAVAIGLAIAAGAAEKKELCKQIIEVNKNCCLPLFSPFSPQQLARASRNDKKRAGEEIELILPEAVGRCRIEKVHVNQLEEMFEKGIRMIKELL